jgi:hypothetical protein
MIRSSRPKEGQSKDVMLKLFVTRFLKYSLSKYSVVQWIRHWTANLEISKFLVWQQELVVQKVSGKVL